jgi:hypothetical protein
MSGLHFKRLIGGGLTALLLLAGAVAAVRAQTYDFKKESGLNVTADKAGYDIANPTSVNNVIGQVILAGLSLVGIAFFGFLIYGGLTWMTARDNEEKVKKANAILLSAIIGLIVTLAAYALTYFLIQYFSLPPAE